VALHLVLLASVSSVAGAQNVTVDGFVRSEGGLPIQNADLDWFNRDLNQDIDPTGDHTDATGYFSVVIPEGRYDITVIGPPASQFAPVFLDNMDLRSSQTLPLTILPDGALVTATVLDESSSPLDSITFVFEDVATGDEAFLLDDDTDPFGNFSNIVPLGTYEVRVLDPGGIHAPDCFDLDVVAPLAMGTLTLKVGHVVIGRVVDGGGGAIFNVDLDVVDEVTGDKVCTFGDNTDFLGDYSLFIPAGTFEFRFAPAPGSPFAPDRQTGVVITGPTNVGVQTLLPGVQVTGTVRDDAASPLPGADIDVIDVVTGLERYTPGDNTNGAGAFSVVVPAGTYDFNFTPPAGVDLAAGVMWDVVISGSTVLPPVQLVPGVQVTGTVRGSGNPIPDVDLDFVVTSNGKHYPTPHDDTGPTGEYAVRVVPGIYDLTATPPVGSGFDPGTITAQSITMDTVIDFDLDATVAVGDAITPDVASRVRIAPNPFQGAVQIRIALPEATTGEAQVSIFDPGGRRVRHWQAGADQSAAATGLVIWDGRDSAGRLVPPGAYFVEVRSGTWRATSRVTRVR